MDDFERNLDLLAQERAKEREKLQRRVESAREALDALERDLDGINAVRRMHREHLGMPSGGTEIDEALRQRFAGLSVKDVLIEIARDNRGLILGKAACETMVRAAMYKDERAASNSLYRTLNRFPDTFRKLARGKYQLREDAPMGEQRNGTQHGGTLSSVDPVPLPASVPSPADYMPQTNQPLSA